ncbi:MAG: V-type ATPase subunit [Oscillospiraceae bacterium]
MLNSFSTNATVAKAKALYGKRLTQADYSELMHRNSVADIAEYLKRNTHFKDILSSIDTNTVRRRYLEQLLKRDVFEKYVRLCKFQQIDKIEFYNYNIIKLEMDAIVNCILNLNSITSVKFIAETSNYLIKHASFDIISLAKAEDFSEVLKVLKKTPYYAILKDEKPNENGRYDCTLIEAKLRSYYYEWLKNAIDKDFSGDTAQELHELIRKQVDVTNIVNAFRLISFSGEKAQDYLDEILPNYGKISGKHLDYLYQSRDDEEFLLRFSKTHYGRQMEKFTDNLEGRLMSHYGTLLKTDYEKRALRKSQSAPVSLFSILFLFTIETENIINIIEVIRYKAPMTILDKLLI